MLLGVEAHFCKNEGSVKINADFVITLSYFLLFFFKGQGKRKWRTKLNLSLLFCLLFCGVCF